MNKDDGRKGVLNRCEYLHAGSVTWWDHLDYYFRQQNCPSLCFDPTHFDMCK